MQKKTVVIIVIEVVMTVLGLFLGGEWARPLPEPPSHETVVWLPTGSIDRGLRADWDAQRVTSQRTPLLSLDEFKMKVFSSRFYGLSYGSVDSSYGSYGTYVVYFGRDTQGKIWAAEQLVSGWSPILEQLPPRPYRPESYSLDPVRSVVMVTTGYDQATAVTNVLMGVVGGLLLLPVVKFFLEFLGELVYAVFGIRFRSPIVKDSG